MFSSDHIEQKTFAESSCTNNIHTVATLESLWIVSFQSD